jgi:hypothetical protein
MELSGRHEKAISLFPKNCFYSAPRLSNFFRFQKIAFSRQHEKAIFSIIEKSFFRTPKISEKSLFQGAMKKRFFRFPKSRFFWAS